MRIRPGVRCDSRIRYYPVKQLLLNAFLEFAFRRTDNFPGLQIDRDSYVFSSFLEAEFIDTTVFDLFPTPAPVFLGQVFFMMIFDSDLAVFMTKFDHLHAYAAGTPN